MASEEQEREEIRRATDKKINELAAAGALAVRVNPETGEREYAIEEYREELEANALRRMRANRAARASMQ